MPDDMMLALATTLVTKGAEAAVEGGRSAIGALVRLVRKRFGHGTAEAATLEAAMERPDQVERRAELAAALADMMRRDPAFATQVRSAWAAVAAQTRVGGDGVLNQFTGTGDKIIQARDITGGVSF